MRRTRQNRIRSSLALLDDSHGARASLNLVRVFRVACDSLETGGLATLLVFALLIAPFPATAIDFQVSTTSDLADTTPGNGTCETSEVLATGGSACSLRAAIEESNATAGADSISLPAGVFALPNGPLEIKDSLTLTGADMKSTAIDGLGLTNVLVVTSLDDESGPPPDVDAVFADFEVRRSNGNGIFCNWMDFGDGAITLDLARVRVTETSGGGAVRNENCAVSVSDAVLDHNLGPALVNLDYEIGYGSALVTRTRIESNQATGSDYISSSIVSSSSCCGSNAFFRMSDSTLTDNTAQNVITGGEAFGLILDRVTIENNAATAIDYSHVVRFLMSRSRIIGNLGRGVDVDSSDGGTHVISDSEISGNSYTGNGGGIHVGSGSELLLRNVTLSHNSAAKGGGVSLHHTDPDVDFENVTIVGNSATEGGGIYTDDADSLNLVNSVVVDNEAVLGPDCATDGPGQDIYLAGQNLIGKIDGCGLTGSEPGLQSGTVNNPLDAQLGPLAFAGGFSRVHLPLPGSPVIDATPAVDCVVTTDQRGALRPQDGDANTVFGCDLGAVEVGDFDQDGIADNNDLCPALGGAAQSDGDGDGIGDECDAFPSDPLNQQTICEVDLGSCSADLGVCDTDLLTCSDNLNVSEANFIQCEADGVALLSTLESCQAGPPILGDINFDSEVNLLDTVLSRRLLAELPINPPLPAVTAMKLRNGDTDELIRHVENGDTYSLAGVGSCIAIQVDLNDASESLRIDWTAPGASEVVAYHSENFAPYCWGPESGWIFKPEIADCGCSPEMTHVGSHRLVVTPCSVDVNFSVGESCAGNGGVEGDATEMIFDVVP